MTRRISPGQSKMVANMLSRISSLPLGKEQSQTNRRQRNQQRTQLKTAFEEHERDRMIPFCRLIYDNHQKI
jgi:hypothetical protein